MPTAALRTLIVDDEPIARQILREELAAFPGVAVVGEAHDGWTAVRHIEALQPDLVLLDIQMPGMTGFDVLRRMRAPLPPAVVFVTAFDAHALEAFEAGAADYLLKPIRTERLVRALSRVRSRRPGDATGAEGLATVLNEVTPAAPRKIVGRRAGSYYLLDLDEVVTIQADGEIIWIQCAGVRYMAAQTLRELEKRLAGSAFRRIHRKALVNTAHIRKLSSLSSQRWLLMMSDGQQVTVSKRLAFQIRDLLS